MAQDTMGAISRGEYGTITPTSSSGTIPSSDKITDDIRLILSLANSDPKLQEALRYSIAGKYDDMYTSIYASDFYKNNTSIARQRQAAKQRQPGAYQSEFNDWKLTVLRRLRRTGITITPEIEGQLENAYLMGMSDIQFDNLLSQKGLVGKIGGVIGGEVTDLKSYASSFGVGKMYNDAYWDQVKKDIFDGTTTIEDEQQKIRDLAASAFPAFADNIKAGQSMASAASYITQTLSNRVGRPLTLESPEVQRFLQWKNPETGKFEQPAAWQVDQAGWSLPGADKTPEAIQRTDSISLRVLRDMGLM